MHFPSKAESTNTFLAFKERYLFLSLYHCDAPHLKLTDQTCKLQMMSFAMDINRGKIRVSPKELRSVSADNPLEDEIIEILESDEYIEYFKFFEEHVEFIDSIRNPFGSINS